MRFLETMPENYKRVNVLIRPDQYERVSNSDLSLSGLVRDLLDDRFSDTTIMLSVDHDTKLMYDHAISNFGAGDHELSKYIRRALDEFLLDKEKEIEKLRRKLRGG
jgi:hypothetical protein